MPTLSYQTRIRAISESASLNLNVRHNIVAGRPSDVVHIIKPSLLATLDVVLSSNLLITISGRLNGSYVLPAVLEKSQIASHLVHYFKANAENLCINAVSGPCMVDNTGFTTCNAQIQIVNHKEISQQSYLVTISCSRPLSEPTPPISIALDRIHLFYDWQTNSASTIDDSLNPFSSCLPLPYLTLVDDVVQRFTASQLVKRYPLIFGNWSKQLHLEKKLASSIWSSIQNIIENSPNEDFRNSSRRIMARMRSRMVSSLTETVSRLSEHLENSGEDTTWAAVSLGDDKDAFRYYMHYVYSRNMRRPMFKGHDSRGPRITSERTDLDIELDFSSSDNREHIDKSCDAIDLFEDNDEMLYDPDALCVLMNDSEPLVSESNESSQTTCCDLDCGPEEMGDEGSPAALHASWSQDSRPFQKHSTCPVMGMDVDTTEGGNSSIRLSSSSCAIPATIQDLLDIKDAESLHLQASLSFSDDTIPVLKTQHDETIEERGAWLIEEQISGNTHHAGNIDLFDLVLQHEYEIGLIPFDRGGHGIDSMAGHPPPTLSYFEWPQNRSHASQAYQDVDNAPHLREISQPARCQSQRLVAMDLDFSVMEF